jgi:hypothetical protein
MSVNEMATQNVLRQHFLQNWLSGGQGVLVWDHLPTKVTLQENYEIDRFVTISFDPNERQSLRYFLHISSEKWTWPVFKKND